MPGEEAAAADVTAGRPRVEASTARSNCELRPHSRVRRALDVLRERYSDYGSTPASDVLARDHGLTMNRELLRQWMSAKGLWRRRIMTRKRGAWDGVPAGITLGSWRSGIQRNTTGCKGAARSCI